MARSREHAAALVADGRVKLGGRPAAKVATQVSTAEPVLVTEPATGEEYVSRGGHKLAGALDAFADRGPRVAGRRCLDAGASTGGFTDVLLRRGAASVVAVDVGYGQLAWSLRSDQRVEVLDRTNVRDLTAESVHPPVELVVGDLSFISLRLVLAPLLTVCAARADLILMVKPQFEVGRESVGKGGVVRDPALRAEAVSRVAQAGSEHGLGVAGVTASPLPGPSGNVEYFLWMRAGAPDADADDIRQAVEEGPS
ncbi:23S rRNA (cytidine1920-2'-O)/16S rRNA (cytidine1409-2'-O)-methyltransferase [Haloactinopolyspora alba]|uniref:23S rRNA (Cytidine1920-2'-O)/16S rRNA (Cytidine1409-2'-O)-methyltransferase n=1 Tax=Haloactinopolyspora alba TaxID=648780 RepID=A0A2P8E219_9ACTN|nr:23S rRNA (cytidine1920-2'-O)/16S rRNA (cytidine1409-2'-O)-methyltransferase [Haloactinopolyspora alba]